MKIIKTLKYWLPLIFYMGLIFYLSSISHPSVPMKDVWNIDKIYHLIEYGMFGFLAFIAFVHTPLDILFRSQSLNGFRSKSPIIFAIVFTAFYGATDEIHQIFVPGRYASGVDWIFDVIGGFLGGFCASIVMKMYRSWIYNRELSRIDEEEL